jgi:hypothetical protein
MSRRTLRTALAAVLLAALLVPAAASAREPTRLEPPAERGLVSAFWDFLDTLFLKTGTDNRWQIDPNGAAAATCPNGGASCVTSDNGWQIDPNG